MLNSLLIREMILDIIGRWYILDKTRFSLKLAYFAIYVFT